MEFERNALSLSVIAMDHRVHLRFTGFGRADMKTREHIVRGCG